MWRQQSDKEIYGVDKFLARTQAGRAQHDALKAAKHDRFGIVKQTKQGHKVAHKTDVGLTTVSQAGVKSKFQSSFGQPPPIQPKKKAYVPSSTGRKKPVSYFDTIKRMSMNESQNMESSQNISQSDVQPVQTKSVQDMPFPATAEKEPAAKPAEPEGEQPQIAQNQGEMEGDDEREPKLYVDVNVANFGLQRIIVYEGDTVESLVSDFVKRCPIDEFMIEKLKTLLQ